MSNRKPSRNQRSTAGNRRRTDKKAEAPLRVHFTKMHGLGNDFMVLDMISHPIQLSTEQIRQLGDRHQGVGFDQLLVIEPPDIPDADFNYRIFNADGSEVEHCGNGARCFARYVLDRGLIAHSPIKVKTQNRLLELHANDNGQISVDMGQPAFDPASLPFNAEPAGQYHLSVPVAPDSEQQTNVTFQAVSMGNPHIVLTVPSSAQAPVGTIGPVLSGHEAFPQGVNAGFMEIVDRSTIRLRVFERGAGETQACGTGACAAAVCGIRAGQLDSPVRVILNGGELAVDWRQEDQNVIMTGPATTVFEGSAVMQQNTTAC